MELIDCIEQDIKHWKTLDENNDVMCSTRNTLISGRSDIVKTFRTNYKDIYRICYRNKQKEILALYKSGDEKIDSVYFSGVGRFFGSVPWIATHNTDSLLFSYFRDGKPNFVVMNQVSNVSQFYENAKDIHLYVDDSYRNDVVKYYDSLPMFKTFSYMLGELDVLSEEEIVIEI